MLTEGRRLVVTERALERRGWPVVEVVDRTDDDPRTGLFSERLAIAARAELDRPDGRVVCVLNRKGRIRVLACRNCGELARCTRCGGAVAQAEAGGGLVCGRCGEVRPAVSAACDSTKLKSLRIGVARATEELAALLATPAVELTADTGPAETLDGARLVVGTEAALHRVDRAGLVVFLEFDQHLLAPRFGAGRRRWPCWPGPPGSSVSPRRRRPGTGPDAGARPRGAGCGGAGRPRDPGRRRATGPPPPRACRRSGHWPC